MQRQLSWPELVGLFADMYLLAMEIAKGEESNSVNSRSSPHDQHSFHFLLSSPMCLSVSFSLAFQSLLGAELQELRGNHMSFPPQTTPSNETLRVCTRANRRHFSRSNPPTYSDCTQNTLNATFVSHDEGIKWLFTVITHPCTDGGSRRGGLQLHDRSPEQEHESWTRVLHRSNSLKNVNKV